MITPAPTLVLSINTTWNLINFRRSLISRLQTEGFKVVAVSPPDGHEVALEGMGVRHVPITIDSKGLSPAADLRLLRDYWSILRDLRPAAFLGWTIKPNIYGSLAAHALGIPTLNNISGLGTAFIKVGPVTSLVRLLYRLALARAATVLFQNPHDRELFVDGGLVSAERTILLPGSGIDLAQFVAVPSDETLPFVFLMVSRLLRDKGVIEFVEAARRVRADRPDVVFRLLGPLDVANRTAVDRATVERWVHDGTIDYLGEARDVRPHLAAASVVVLPSYREGMPRSLLEAAAMGKPLIATDVPGCTEIARPGENAILCPPRNADALGRAMLAMLDLPTVDRLRMGQRSRIIAEQEFDTRLVEERYLVAIERAIVDRATSVAGKFASL